MKYKIDIIVGARPNFMKAAALFNEKDKYSSIEFRLIHTGQHYDKILSDVFIDEFNLPQPTCCLGVGSGSHTYQTSKIMMGYEKWIEDHRPHICIVVGDVNSTIACAIVAKKNGITLSHVEAGLRSFDRTMPEEINRVLTDSISDMLFVTEPSGIANLANEGHSMDGIYYVGNVMIDTLVRLKPKAEAVRYYSNYDLNRGEYAYLTLHRPSNVDDPKTLVDVINNIEWMAEKIPVVFPIHPRTKKNLIGMKLIKRLELCKGLIMIEPISYIESLSLMINARLVVTDSGGLQEETTYLGIPCLCLRDNTERPITITNGTNTLIGSNWELFRNKVVSICNGSGYDDKPCIPYWDGKAGGRIVERCYQYLIKN